MFFTVFVIRIKSKDEQKHTCQVWLVVDGKKEDKNSTIASTLA